MPTETESQTAESAPHSTLNNQVEPDTSVKGRKIRERRKTATSEKKIESNRRNALRSTGARTKRGKKHSSFNALRFGLYAGPQVLPGESYHEHRALLLSLAKDLKPHGPIEEMYVTQIEGGMRRLKRVDVAEHAFIYTQMLTLAEKMGDRHSETYQYLALGPVLAGILNQPFDGIDDKVSRRRKQIIGEINENLKALQECQLHRAIEIESQLSERRIEALQNRRFLPAQKDSTRDIDNDAVEGPPPPYTPRPRRSIAQPD